MGGKEAEIRLPLRPLLPGQEENPQLTDAHKGSVRGLPIKTWTEDKTAGFCAQTHRKILIGISAASFNMSREEERGNKGGKGERVTVFSLYRRLQAPTASLQPVGGDKEAVLDPFQKAKR